MGTRTSLFSLRKSAGGDGGTLSASVARRRWCLSTKVRVTRQAPWRKPVQGDPWLAWARKLSVSFVSGTAVAMMTTLSRAAYVTRVGLACRSMTTPTAVQWPLAPVKFFCCNFLFVFVLCRLYLNWESKRLVFFRGNARSRDGLYSLANAIRDKRATAPPLQPKAMAAVCQNRAATV